MATVTFNDEAEQFAVAAGQRPDHSGALGIVRRLFGKLGDTFSQATVRSSEVIPS